MTDNPNPRACPQLPGDDWPTASERGRFGRGGVVALFLAFLLLGAFYTLPLVAHLDEALPFAAVPTERHENLWRSYGDYLQFYYYLWLVRERLLAGASFLRDPYQFATDGPRLNLPNTFLPVALLYLPLSVLGPRVAYNLLVLLSFPFAGLAATLLVHRYGVGCRAALVAGAIFACAPYRVGALLGGHPAGVAYFLVPLALWGLEGALAGSVAGGAWAGAALLSMAIVEPHFFYFAVLGLPLYLLARVGLAAWTRNMLGVGARLWLAAVAVALAPAWGVLAGLARQGWRPPLGTRLGLAAVVALGVLAFWQCAAGWLRLGGVTDDARAAARRSLLGCLPWLATAAAGLGAGARITAVTLGVPALIHVWWLLRARHARRLPVLSLALAGAGAVAGVAHLLVLQRLILSRAVAGPGRTLGEVLLFSPSPADLLVRVNPAANRAIYLGGVALALAFVGIVRLGRKAPPPPGRILLAFGPLLVLATALSLGPRLTAVPLFEAAFRLVPSWNFVRQPAKFQVLAGLALAVLAAVGADALASRLRGRWSRAALPVALALLVAAEYHPWRPAGLSRLPTAGEEYDVIRRVGPRALYLPLWPGDSALSAAYLHTTTLTRVPMLNGYSAYIDRAYVTDVYRALEGANLGIIGEAEYATLKRYGVRQVVLDRDVFPLKVNGFGAAFTLAGLRGSPYLEVAWAPPDGRPLWVFRVREGAGGRPQTVRSPVGIYWEAEGLARETGQVLGDADASNGRVVLARAGRDPAGFVVFGPYRRLPPGPFRAVFRLRGGGTTVELEVTAAEGRRRLGAEERSLAEGDPFHDAVVPFAIEAPTAVEYRVRWSGTGWVAVDSVSVSFADVPDPAPAFEAEALPHGLLERQDPAASGGLAIYADPAKMYWDLTWEGPFRRYPAGLYRLWIRLKVDRTTSAPLAWCGARAASAGPVFGSRELSGAEVPVAGQYVELAVPFALPRPAVLEFPCLYRHTAGLWFDRLRVEGPSPRRD